MRSCASHRRARDGGKLRLVGSGLSGVTKVTFLGARGKSDDVSVNVRPSSDRSINVKVPFNAMSGRLALTAPGTVTTSDTTQPLGILPPPPPPPTTGKLTPVPGPSQPGAPQLETATSKNVAFAGSSSGVTFSYRVSAPGAVPVEVDLVRVTDGTVVQTWQVPAVQPGVVNKITWRGVSAGALQPDGLYAWRLTATGASGATARSAQAPDSSRDSFDLHDHIFPVRGRHTFGDGFGVQRSGHTHQGQDILARCGLKIAAAEAGTVEDNKYQSAAGYYLVIHGSETGIDYAYMHMRAPSPFQAGDQVTTGETLGNVGDTGDATACHLHFEMWSAPGWYNGGHPFDPLPSLQQWDAYS
ncbi:MAG TPA: peptidoglycan DD-metalloendopeptidase family protein [Thermoleophilaceae bacterium]|nr:peptidoglycan DD-metalloendopeptidase family protein [Thermoleophilaceae bacterium]